MRLEYHQVDAFAERPFAGNPAAVVSLTEWLDDELMQRIAAELNLSETAFFVPDSDAPGRFHIRWFTPATEVPLCGHATLASAAVVSEVLQCADWPITFDSASGPLQVDRAGATFTLDLPANPPKAVAAPDGLAEALGCSTSDCLLGNDIFLVALESEQQVRQLKPDFNALSGHIEHGVIVTAVGDAYDFVSRFFAPSIGIDEDPVTGAAHCVLTPYWADRLGKSALHARQISARGGDVACELRYDRVALSGAAVFFSHGNLTVPDET